MQRICIIIILIAGTLFTTFCSAQNRESKSSNSTTSYKKFKARSSRESGEALLRQAIDVRKKDPLEALQIVQDALGLSIAENDVYTEARCYVLLGEINESIGEWKLALENYSRAHE